MVLWAAATGASHSAELDRLLPTDQEAKVSVTAKQDGRAVDISVNNGSQLVLTGGQVRCFAKRPAPSSSASGCPPVGPITFTAEYLLGPVSASEAQRGKNKQGVKRAPQDERASDPYCANSHFIGMPTEVLVKQLGSKILPGKEGQLYAELAPGVALGSCVLSDARGRERRLLDGF
jgi:hypothetical protein